MSELSSIVLSQTQAGPHVIGGFDILLLLGLVFVIILLEPYFSSWPLVKHG